MANIALGGLGVWEALIASTVSALGFDDDQCCGDESGKIDSKSISLGLGVFYSYSELENK
jgi:hypothetical protein